MIKYLYMCVWMFVHMLYRQGFVLDLATCLAAAALTAHLKRTLREVGHAHACETGFKSQPSLSQEVLSIHLRLHSCIHSDTQCHLKGRN